MAVIWKYICDAWTHESQMNIRSVITGPWYAGSKRGCFSEQDTIIEFCEYGKELLFYYVYSSSCTAVTHKTVQSYCKPPMCCSLSQPPSGTYTANKNTALANYVMNTQLYVGRAVSIATGYGLDGPGIESRWGRDFPHLSRPVLGPTQPPINL